MKGKEWKQYLIQQAELHPAMEPRDVYKLMYQAAFGAEHLLQDQEAAYAYFQEEYDHVKPEGDRLYEQIHARVCRVNLGAWKKKNLPSEWLFRMFVNSAKIQQGEGVDEFRQYMEVAKEAAEEGVFRFTREDFSQFGREYEKREPGPVHHSENYRLKEHPAYRLVCARYIRLLPVLEAMAAIRKKNPDGDVRAENSGTAVIAIDGRCASGKTTMARMLSEITGAGVIHMDDFFLPMELRTEERLTQPGGNVHYERFAEEILPRLGMGGDFTYRRFDCGKMQMGEYRSVEASPFRIVEGAYSCHPAFGGYADLKIFSDVQGDEQLERIRRRDGEEALSMFRERWIPMEEKYFAACHIKEDADMVIS